MDKLQIFDKLSDVQETNIPNQREEYTISLMDIVQFIKESYKKIVLFALSGSVSAAIFTFALGQYTASVTLLNYADLNIIRIKYLQVALPKLSQEDSIKSSENYLASEQIWKSAIKANSLVGKSDAKDLIDPASPKSDRFNIYAIEIIGKANDKQLAKERAQEISNFFINGTAFINLRDLVRQYKLQVTTTNAELGTKTLNAKIELAFIEQRIKNLNELKKQFPNTINSQNNSLQYMDAKESAAKYLPILTQIIAATADQNNQLELLQRYKEESSQMLIYNSFIEKAKPFMDAGLKDPKLVANLLNILYEAKKEINTNYEKVTLSTIEGDLKKIMAFKLYSLPQVGSVGIVGPAYLKNIAIGLFGGAMMGILFALGLRVSQRLRVEMKSSSVK
jgi:hypothetical protein